jgi:hypothetical protein
VLPIDKKRGKRRRSSLQQHLCFDRAYNSISVNHEISKRGHVPQVPHKRKRGEEEKEKKDAIPRKRHYMLMGCGENKLMAQQVQETVHKM